MLKIDGLLLLILPLATAGAQSQASVTDSRIITEKNGGKPDTLLIRTITSGRRTRVDLSGPGSLVQPWRMMGTTQLGVVGDSGMTSAYLDSAKKTYWSTNPRALQASITTIGLDINPVTPGDTLTLDSLGSGGVVGGHNTVHFRARSAIRLTVPAVGEVGNITEMQTTDYYIIPGPPIDSMGKAALPMQTPVLQVSSGAKELGAERARAMARMAKTGNIIKTVIESKTTSMGGVISQRQTTETLDRRTMSVPDSLFVIPAGYTKVAPSFIPTP